MKVFLKTLALVLFLTSCGDDKRTNYATMDDDGNMVMSDESEEIMDDLLKEFKECRQTSTKNLLDCKCFIAKALCQFYEIDDFRKGTGYVDYNEMYDIVKGKFGTWEAIGSATDQRALNKAQDKANNGQATVAISRASEYGHVVVIIPGHTTKAPSWGGLMVPNCASFFMVKHLEPFVGKSLAYAWSDPSEVMLFSRKLD